MASETETAVPPGPTIPAENFPDTIRPMATDLNAYLREAPRLLRAGEEGRYALVNGGQFLSTWDTYADALQAGYEQFGADGLFIVQNIDRRQYERFLMLLDSPPGPPS